MVCRFKLSIVKYRSGATLGTHMSHGQIVAIPSNIRSFSNKEERGLRPLSFIIHHAWSSWCLPLCYSSIATILCFHITHTSPSLDQTAQFFCTNPTKIHPPVYEVATATLLPAPRVAPPAVAAASASASLAAPRPRAAFPPTSYTSWPSMMYTWRDTRTRAPPPSRPVQAPRSLHSITIGHAAAANASLTRVLPHQQSIYHPAKCPLLLEQESTMAPIRSGGAIYGGVAGTVAGY
ncbi:hypothetical protein EDB92DRAFT_1630738 [Lactarius akahatsu]|uniref:Uncharacterized protein n=1 Tax=Lactarius akahatsu TaxID=416441 RepID=A0AAD4L981_9AGAM|nr:hypothetical protein EDB92DRAFT_1630738 [Lactarius akahatsu]